MAAKSLSTVYQVVTDRILDLLNQGVIPWRRPWVAVGAPRNLVTGREYRGFNVFMLAAQGYRSPFWATFKQIQERGGHVRKGERSTPVVFWGWVKEEKQNDGTTKKLPRAIPFVRYYNVFNVEQTEGLTLPATPAPVVASDATAEQVVAEMPKRPEIRTGGDAAYYSPAADYVQMPERAAFESTDAFYQVLFHELTHATGHASRLARKDFATSQGFGSIDYSQEELVAEMGAAFLTAHCGLSTSDRVKQSAAYIQTWLTVLQNDPTMVVFAAQQAQKAADYITRAEPAEAGGSVQTSAEEDQAPAYRVAA